MESFFGLNITMLRIVVVYFVICIVVSESSPKQRDDGAFASDSGGPVASVGEEELTESIGDSNVTESEEPLYPCEKEETKKFGSVSLQKLFELEPTSFYKVALSGQQNSNSEQSFSYSPKNEFIKFMTKFNKTYPTIKERDDAFEIFSDNFVNMLQLSLKRKSLYDASFAVTEFMDLPYDCLQENFMGAVPRLEDGSLINIDEKLSMKPPCESLSWTMLDVVPQVRKQTKCGCCYAMSTADMIGAQYAIDEGTFNVRYNLSPQWFTDCTKAPAGYHCKGGRPFNMLEELKNFTKYNYIPLESCYPYKDRNGTCFMSVDCPDTPDISVKWGRMVDVSGPNEKNFMAALLRHGPVVAIVGVTQSWQFYNGTGIIRPRQCSEHQKHAVLITGYDYSSCVPYYVIKNSWGTTWGGKGYIKLEAGRNTCNVAKTVVFTCTSNECENEDPLHYVLTHPKHPDCKS